MSKALDQYYHNRMLKTIEDRYHYLHMNKSKKGYYLFICNREYDIIRFSCVDYCDSSSEFVFRIYDDMANKPFIENTTEIYEFQTSNISFIDLTNQYVERLNIEHLEYMQNIYYFITGKTNMYQ